MRSVAIAIAIAIFLALGSSGTATAAAPAVTKTFAKKMQCKWPESTSMALGGRNSGVKCVVKNRLGRQEFYVLKYRNIERAVDAWRDWISRDAYVTRKGRIMIVSQGNNGRRGDWGYTYKWAKYAANQLDGRLIRGY